MNKALIVCIVISLIIILSLTIILTIGNKKDSEKFCQSRPMINSVCPNTYEQTQLYETGKLTENTKLGGCGGVNKTWPMAMPDQIFEAQIRGEKIPFPC